MRQLQCVPTAYVIENKEANYFEIYMFKVSYPLCLPRLTSHTANQYTNSCHSTHTGQCKRTGGCYNELVVAFFSTGGGVKGKKIYTC